VTVVALRRSDHARLGTMFSKAESKCVECPFMANSARIHFLKSYNIWRVPPDMLDNAGQVRLAQHRARAMNVPGHYPER
jgi:hypothetical protein